MEQNDDKKPSSKSIADWKIFGYLKDPTGKFSITKLFSLFIIVSAIIEWQYAYWIRPGIWHPTKSTIGLIIGVIGVNILQKIVGTNTGIKKISDIQQTIDLGKKE